MSADNELVIAEFTDCFAVKMQFASNTWELDMNSATCDPEEIRSLFQGGYGKLFVGPNAEDGADIWAEEEENKSYYEYGCYDAGKYDFALYPDGIPEEEDVVQC